MPDVHVEMWHCTACGMEAPKSTPVEELPHLRDCPNLNPYKRDTFAWAWWNFEQAAKNFGATFLTALKRDAGRLRRSKRDA